MAQIGTWCKNGTNFMNTVKVNILVWVFGIWDFGARQTFENYPMVLYILAELKRLNSRNKNCLKVPMPVYHFKPSWIVQHSYYTQIFWNSKIKDSSKWAVCVPCSLYVFLCLYITILHEKRFNMVFSAICKSLWFIIGAICTHFPNLHAIYNKVFLW